MLSLFPQLFAYSELAPLILRLVAGFMVIGFGYPRLFKPSERFNFAAGLVFFCSGILLLFGLLTQLGAGLIILASFFVLFYADWERNYKFFILLVAVSLALMFLGPGIFSLDLPL